MRWDGRDEGGKEAPGGVYLTRMETAAGSITGKLILAR